MMVLFASITASAQVTIGSTNQPSKFSLLDLDAREQQKGLHNARLTTAQRDALVTPDSLQVIKDKAVGLLLFNTTNNCLEFWNGREWISLCEDALFDPPPVFTLTANITGTGEVRLGTPTGAVFATGEFTEGTEIMLVAVPPVNRYVFARWEVVSGAITPTGLQTTPTLTFAMPNSNVTVTAVFELNEYTVTTAVNPTGTGTVAGGGDHIVGEEATLTATPNANRRFTGWTVAPGVTLLGGFVLTDATIKFNMPANNVTATANFVNEYTVTTAVNPTGTGTVTITGGKTAYTVGEEVELTAMPNANQRFTGWTVAPGVTLLGNGAALTDATIKFNMPANNVTATANFELDMRPPLTTNIHHGALTLHIGGVNTTPTVGTRGVTQNATVTITAVPTCTIHTLFVGWTITGVTVANQTTQTISFQMPNGPVSVLAQFGLPVNTDFYFGWYPQTLLTAGELANLIAAGGVAGFDYEQVTLGSDTYHYWNATNNRHSTDIATSQFTRRVFDDRVGSPFRNQSGTTHYFRYDPIKWRVLGYERGISGAWYPIVMTEHVLDAFAWNLPLAPSGSGNLSLSVMTTNLELQNSQTATTGWSTSVLRYWLNGTYLQTVAANVPFAQNQSFYNRAFIADERAVIVPRFNAGTAINRPTTQPALGQWEEDQAGPNTTDKIFVLTRREIGAEGPFGFPAANLNAAGSYRVGSVTTFARARGVVRDGNGGGTYWLRSPGTNTTRAARVLSGGNVNMTQEVWGSSLGMDTGVRPVLKVNWAAVTPYIDAPPLRRPTAMSPAMLWINDEGTGIDNSPMPVDFGECDCEDDCDCASVGQ